MRGLTGQNTLASHPVSCSKVAAKRDGGKPKFKIIARSKSLLQGNRWHFFQSILVLSIYSILIMKNAQQQGLPGPVLLTRELMGRLASRVHLQTEILNDEARYVRILTAKTMLSCGEGWRRWRNFAENGQET
jgi:hypothetical protein